MHLPHSLGLLRTLPVAPGKPPCDSGLPQRPGGEQLLLLVTEACHPPARPRSNVSISFPFWVRKPRLQSLNHVPMVRCAAGLGLCLVHSPITYLCPVYTGLPAQLWGTPVSKAGRACGCVSPSALSCSSRHASRTGLLPRCSANAEGVNACTRACLLTSYPCGSPSWSAVPVSLTSFTSASSRSFPLPCLTEGDRVA